MARFRYSIEYIRVLGILSALLIWQGIDALTGVNSSGLQGCGSWLRPVLEVGENEYELGTFAQSISGDDRLNCPRLIPAVWWQSLICFALAGLFLYMMSYRWSQLKKAGVEASASKSE